MDVWQRKTAAAVERCVCVAAYLVLPVRTDGVTTAVLVGRGILTMTFRAKRVGSNCARSAEENNKRGLG